MYLNVEKDREREGDIDKKTPFDTKKKMVKKKRNGRREKRKKESLTKKRCQQCQTVSRYTKG